jgi:hypothetical protein
MTTTNEVSCPKCGGLMWDNRVTKRNPKSPDYKCRNKSCDGVVWPPKPGASAPRAAVAAAVASSPMELGGYIPGLDDEPPPPDGDVIHAPPHTNGNGTAASKLPVLFALQETCFLHALKLAGIAKQKGIPVTLEGVSALTAQAMIAATR